MAKPVTHTVDFLSAAEEDLHRYTNFHQLVLFFFLTACQWHLLFNY